MKRIILYIMPLVVYMAIIFVLSVRPSPASLPDLWSIDKLYHLSAYFIMGILMARALYCGGRRRTMSFMALVILSTASVSAFGAFIEYCQSCTGYRSAEVFDAVANGIGGLLGALLYVKFRGQRR